MCKFYLGNNQCKEAWEADDVEGFVICDGIDHSCPYFIKLGDENVDKKSNKR